MSADKARKRIPHEQGRSGITIPSRPGHGGDCRSATTRNGGGLIMKCKRVSHRRMVAIGAVTAGEARPTTSPRAYEP